MRKFLIKQFGGAWKTKLLGYVVAMMMSIQPLLSVEVDPGKKIDLMKYIFRVLFAVIVAVMGKYVADITEVKRTKKRSDVQDIARRN